MDNPSSMNACMARERILKSTSLAVLSGAGISAESGVPTFRGSGGLWENHRAEELATPGAFGRDPALVWRFYDWRRGVLAGIRPNPAHYALARAAGRPGGVKIITQNVDGLHALAGSGNVLELHGNIWRVRCQGCKEVSENRDVPIRIPPYCGGCGGLLRPDIVWFGEGLPPDVFQSARRAAERADVMLVIGTAGAVEPAASLAAMAKASGAYLIEINTAPTALSGIMDVVIEGRAGKTVPGLF